MANTKYLNQVKLTGTFTPSNTAIVASDDGQVVAQKTQGQINAFNPAGNEPVFNGIENSALFSVTYSAANKQFSVTYTAGAAYTVGGVRYTPAAGTVTTTAHANTIGAYYLYYDAAGALTVSATFWNLLITAPVASVYYNSSNAGGAAAGILQNEFHPGVTGMSNATHLNLHTTRGTQLLSGCAATGYTLNTAGAAKVNWTTTSGSVADEDLILSVTAQALGGANTYRILWLTGTTVAPVWNWIDQAESGVYSDGTNIYYNQNNAGTWQLTPITSNLRWVNYYIVATTAYNTPQIIVVMGQNLYTSLSAAQGGTFATDCSNFGFFTSEAVVLYQVIYRRATGNGAPGNAEISAFTRVIQNLVIVGLSAATQASNVTVNTATFTNFFTASDNNVQQALNDLDAGVPFSLSHGGTNANLTANNGGIFYSTATAGAILAGTATANRTLLSGSSTTPAWSTATYPATTTINRILYSSNNSVIGEITTANSAVLVTDAGGVPSISTTLPAVAAGSCTCTDPTTSSSASINTALANVYSAVGSITYHTAYNNTSYNLINNNAWQLITNTAITLAAGTWLIYYSLSIYATGTAGSTIQVISTLYNNTTSAVIGSGAAIVIWFLPSTTNYGAGAAGNGMAVLTVTGSTSVQIAAKNINANLNVYQMQYANITAIKLS